MTFEIKMPKKLKSFKKLQYGEQPKKKLKQKIRIQIAKQQNTMFINNATSLLLKKGLKKSSNYISYLIQFHEKNVKSFTSDSV